MPRESLSALVDGECSAAELEQLLAAMEQSPELKQAYSRLCMAREAGEGTRIIRQQRCISVGVMTRVAAEPMLEVGPKVIDLDSRRRWAGFRTVAGFAAAASVAAVAVLLAMPQMKQDPGDASGRLLPRVSTPAEFAPVSVPLTRRSRDLRAVAYTPEQAEQMDDLNGFLIEHSNTLAEPGVGGTLRYARYAAHSAQSPAGSEDQR